MTERFRSSTRVALTIVVAVTIVASLGWHWLITMFAIAVVAAVALVQPATVACVVLLSIPAQSEIMIPFVRGELTITQMLLFGLVPGWCIVFWKRRIWLDAVVLGFLLVMAAFLASYINVDASSLWIQETYRWAIAGVFYVIFRSVFTSWKDVHLAIWMTAIGVLGVSVVAVLQSVGFGAQGGWLANGTVRVLGTMGTPNTLAAYLEFTVPLIAAVVVACRFGAIHIRGIEQITLAGISMIGLGVIGLTQSRGGWLGATAALLVLWLALPGRARLYTLMAGILLATAFMFSPPGQSMLTRLGLTQDQSVILQNLGAPGGETEDGRVWVWATARSMIRDHPIVGVGAGEFSDQFREHAPIWGFRFPFNHAHNVWLQMGAQAGFLGIASFAVWYLASLWGTITARRRATSAANRWIITGVLAILAAYSVHSLVDYLNVLSLGLQISAVTAIALNLAPEPLTRYLPESRRLPLIPYPEQRECQSSEVNPTTGWA